MEKLFKIYIICCCLHGLTKSAAVLVLPLAFSSHILYHAKIARLLAEEGHAVDILLPSHAKIPDSVKESEVNVVVYKMDGVTAGVNKDLLGRILVENALVGTGYRRLTNYLRKVRHHDPSWGGMKTDLLKDRSTLKQIESTRYDVAIVDFLGLPIYASLNLSKSIPVIGFGVMCYEWSMGVPALPSFVPMPLTGLTNQMSFFERLANALLFAISHIGFKSMSQSPIPIRHMQELCSFYFVLDDIALSYPRPTMTNVAFVGDAIPDPGEPLPHDLAKFVDTAEHGVVVISFGTYFDYLPSDVIAKFCSAFERIPQKVIWKQNNVTVCGSTNEKILISSWIPQNDLLSNKNVKLLISHCGKNSILEAIYHSTPAICFPVSVDQPQTAYLLDSRGLGRVMQLGEFTSDELVAEIAFVLGDKRISRNMQTASSLFRNKSDTPSKRISYWVQHLALHGADHLRTSATELNIFQFYCLDVLSALFTGMLVLFITIVYLLKLVYRFTKRMFSNNI